MPLAPAFGEWDRWLAFTSVSLLHRRGAAVLIRGIGGDGAAGDTLARPLGDEDPGFRIAVGVGRAGAGALAGAAVVLAGLDDAGAFFGVVLGGLCGVRGHREGDGDQAGQAAGKEGLGCVR